MNHLDEPHLTKQIVIVHLSDLHFGQAQIQSPANHNGRHSGTGRLPDASGKAAEDLDQPDPKCPVLLCITGDLAESANPRNLATQSFSFGNWLIPGSSVTNALSRTSSWRQATTMLCLPERRRGSDSPVTHRCWGSLTGTHGRSGPGLGRSSTTIQKISGSLSPP